MVGLLIFRRKTRFLGASEFMKGGFRDWFFVVLLDNGTRGLQADALVLKYNLFENDIGCGVLYMTDAQKGKTSMFESLKKKLGFGPAEIIIAVPVAGHAVPLSEVSDPTFSEEILGKGAAIIPSEGRVVSPVDGKVELMFDTGHAVSLCSEDGTEVLVHVGLDTVKLAGMHYKVHKKNGDAVKKGDLLIGFDLDAIRAEGYDPITPVVICNTDAYSSVQAHTGMTVGAQDTLLTLKK